MYIPHHELQAVHQDVVESCLKRSRQRRMLKELEKPTATAGKTFDSRTTLTALVRSMFSLGTRV